MNPSFFSSPSDDSIVVSNVMVAEYERTIEISDTYSGPHLCFPLTVADTNSLLQAFKHRQASSQLWLNGVMFNFAITISVDIIRRNLQHH